MQDVHATHARAERTYCHFLQTFLVSLFLDCPPYLGIRCPNDTEVEVRSGCGPAPLRMAALSPLITLARANTE